MLFGSAEPGVEGEVRLAVEVQRQLQAGIIQRAAQVAGEDDVVLGFLQLQAQADWQQRGAGLLQLQMAFQPAAAVGAGQAGGDALDAQLARQPGEQAGQLVATGQAAGLAGRGGRRLPVELQLLHGKALQVGLGATQPPIELQGVGAELQATAVGGQLLQLQALQLQAVARQYEALPVEADDALLLLQPLPLLPAVAGRRQQGEQQAERRP
ncbi:hypothetical protein D3C75_826080 [compost metagenome]